MKTIILLISLMLGFGATTAIAQQEQPFREGLHYVELAEPVRERNPDQIEVVEIFWYGCHHCYDLEPALTAWEKQLPADVDFIRSPVVWNKVTELHARAFYTAQSLGVLDKVHEPLFTALNIDRQVLNSKDKLAEFFAQHGVEKARFLKTFDSFGVTSQVNQAKARMLSYKVEGTPELVVAGKYRVTGRGVEGQAGKLEVADWLIARERKDSESR